MAGLSLPHLLIIAAVLLLFYGPSRLPQLGSSLGKTIRGFKNGLENQEGEEQLARIEKDPPSKS
jgi:sec-independent protein translocase protein TatA